MEPCRGIYDIYDERKQKSREVGMELEKEWKRPKQPVKIVWDR